MVHKVKEVSVAVTVNPESVTRGPDSIREVLKASQGVPKTDQKRHRGCNVDFSYLITVTVTVTFLCSSLSVVLYVYLNL